eukprot:365086-Chlamydomonas_euryale.AAC.7
MPAAPAPGAPGKGVAAGGTAGAAPASTGFAAIGQAGSAACVRCACGDALRAAAPFCAFSTVGGLLAAAAAAAQPLRVAEWLRGWSTGEAECGPADDVFGSLRHAHDPLSAQSGPAMGGVASSAPQRQRGQLRGGRGRRRGGRIAPGTGARLTLAPRTPCPVVLLLLNERVLLDKGVLLEEGEQRPGAMLPDNAAGDDVWSAAPRHGAAVNADMPRVREGDARGAAALGRAGALGVDRRRMRLAAAR